MKRYFIIIGIALMALTACSDYLDLVPENDLVSVKSTFEKRNTALEFQLTCYEGLDRSMGTLQFDPAFAGGDEFITCDYSKNTAAIGYMQAHRIAEGLQNSLDPIMSIWGDRPSSMQMPYANRYKCIRYCNTFIENVDNVYDMSEQEKARYKAEVKAIKAYYYLELVRQYGPISLMPKNIGVEASAEEMQVPRSPVDSCFAAIVQLFDEAIPDLLPISEQPSSRIVFFTREAAYAYKAKALVYAASPLYNGNDWYNGFRNKKGELLFSQDYDASKWQAAATALDEAVAFCESTGRGLVSGASSEPTPKRNTIVDIHNSSITTSFNNNEYIFAFWGTDVVDNLMRLPRYNSKDPNYYANALGCLNPSMRMVELFYTENGLPISDDRTWAYDQRYKMGRETNSEYDGIVNTSKQVLNLHLRREPRFYADIAADRCYWERGPKDIWTSAEHVEMNPYRNGAHGTEQDRIAPTIPQNLSGYWTKKMLPTEVLPYNASEISFPVVAMRMAELYLLQAEAWNEVSGPSAKVFEAMDKVRARAGVPPVEQAWNTFSNNPAKISTKEGLRDVIQQETNIEFAFEGHRFWDMRRWKTAHLEMNKPLLGWNVFGEDETTFYNGFQGPIKVSARNKFEAPRDYFWPIRSEEILVANVVQNPGW